MCPSLEEWRTKWNDQPLSVEAIPEAVLRGYRIAVTEPAGPVYVCFDMLIQEQALPEGFRIPDVARYQPAKSPESERGAVQEVARLLVGAEMPLCLADRGGRDAAAVRTLVELAELLAMPVVNLGGRHSFPAPHALDFVGMQKALMREADVVLGLDVQDLEGATRTDGREGTDPTIASISLDEMSHRGMTLDCQALPAVDVPILGDTRLALPRLLDECQSLLDDAARERIERRRAALEPRQEQLRARHQRYLEEQWDHPQISEARLLAETWEAVKHEDFVFTLVRVQRMALGICELPGPERNIGLGGGGAVGSGPGVALGGALALKGTGKLPVAILGDGEFLSSIQALWTAAHYQIPSVWILNNNRSYFNDEDHQTRIAVARNRPPENKWIGERMENPAVDFTAVVKGFGLEAIGPVKEVADLPAALRRAVEIAKTGQLVVVDVWTENRPHG